MSLICFQTEASLLIAFPWNIFFTFFISQSMDSTVITLPNYQKKTLENKTLLIGTETIA